MDAENKANESIFSMAEEIKDKLNRGTYSLVGKRGRSEVWHFISKIKDENGDIMNDVVACKLCLSVLKYSGSTSNLVKHKCYIVNATKFRKTSVDVSLETKQECATIATEWVIKNCRPLKIVEDSGLKKLVFCLIGVGATFGANVDVDKLFPHPITLSRNIERMYDEHFQPIKDEIGKYKDLGYSITSDIWTDNYLKASYLSCTVHYIKEGVLVDRMLAIKPMRETNCTGINIRAKIQEILGDFGCDFDVDNPVIVTDRGSSMIKAFHSFEKIHCVNHLLNNAVEKAVDCVPELRTIITICNKLVRFFQEPEMNSCLEDLLKSFCPTRRNTVYFLLKSIESNWLNIISVLQKKNQMNRIEGINIKHLNQIVRLLGTFEQVSKRLEVSKRPTIHLVVPNINKLKKFCQVEPKDIEIIKTLKMTLDSEITAIVMPNLTMYHNIALFLFPPTSKLIQFSPIERVNTINECKKLMGNFLERKGCNTAENPTANSKEFDEFENFNEFDEFAEFVDVNQAENNFDQVQQEIAGYFNINVKYTTDFDVLAWWSLHKNFFPLLFKISCRIFSIPASSEASERTFSKARNLITGKGSLIETNSETINKVLFLHSNIN